MGIGVLAGRLRRLVILSGVTGVEVRSVLEASSKWFSIPAYKFEDYISDVFHSPVYEVIDLLLESRKAALGKFKIAYSKLIESIEGLKSIIATHLTYYRRGHIIPNPIIPDLISIADEAYIILYIEDYYHALSRIAERVRRGKTPGAFADQPLDPLSYMYWRASDYSMAALLESMGNVKVIVYGMKHSVEGHMRLLAYTLGESYKGAGLFKVVYISHPITKVRARAEELSISLWSFKDSSSIESFKSRLENKCKNVIILSPTTIDELIVDKSGYLKKVIDKSSRWPHTEETLHEYNYPVDLESSIFDETLYPLDKTIKSKGYMEILKTMIENQIDSRDLAYVSQADALIVYRPTLYGERHIGVDVEIERGRTQAKPIYSIILDEDKVEPHPMRHVGTRLKDEDSLYTALKCID